MRREVWTLLLAGCGSPSQPATVRLEAPSALPSPPPVVGHLERATPRPIEGTYDLDTEATFRQAKAKLRAALGGTSPDVMKMALEMMRSLHMTLDLRAGGAATVEMEMPSGVDAGPPNARETTWTQDGAEIVVPLGSEEIRCTRDHDELTCTEPNENKITLVFHRRAR